MIWILILGIMIGGIVCIGLMCFLQINRDNELQDKVTILNAINEDNYNKYCEALKRINRAIEYIGNKNIGIPRKTREKAIAILGGKE